MKALDVAQATAAFRKFFYHEPVLNLNLLFMNFINRKNWIVALGVPLVATGLLLSGCGRTQTGASSAIPAIPVAQADYRAGVYQAYAPAAYQKALADGKTVMLDFHADWCAVCVNNAPIIEETFQSLNDSSLVGFKVNYDTETALKDQFGVRSQATLILVRNGAEVKRVMGPQTGASMTALLQS